MRKIALITALTVAAAALVGIAGMITASVTDSGSAVVVMVVIALGIAVIGLLEWTHRHSAAMSPAVHGADLAVSTEREHARDRDTLRALDELRAARSHHAGPADAWSSGHPSTGRAHASVSHALRSV
jgi:hypothetical protein